MQLVGNDIEDDKVMKAAHMFVSIFPFTLIWLVNLPTPKEPPPPPRNKALIRANGKTTYQLATGFLPSTLQEFFWPSTACFDLDRVYVCAYMYIIIYKYM